MSSIRSPAIRKTFPNFVPRNDFDILALSDNRYHGSEAEIYTWLDGELAILVEAMGDVESAIAGAEAILGVCENITGAKPTTTTPHVFVRPIPHSPYSLRLFPGSVSLKEFCMDFVHTKTGRPVNSPFPFELWSTSGQFHCQPTVRLVSLERLWGHSQKSVAPGEEKFVLREGTTCILRRPGRRDLRFTVPVRVCPVDSSDVDELDLPLVIH
ncbi:hypothetical protein C8Q76DRAFT_765596 [Earliella scabrosa]|nr:hypothetical protein C8Q76DRAFT_772118 [Earliella scabrosa]KAI0741226.1 hypothetical protein C8Q76DRAFT_765596 [Earliella scabrosa]